MRSRFSVICASFKPTRAAGEISRICSELIFGYNPQPEWTEQAGITFDPADAPCPDTLRLQTFMRLRSKLDGCLYGFGLAKDRAANSLTSVMIPEALDYPM